MYKIFKIFLKNNLRKIENYLSFKNRKKILSSNKVLAESAYEILWYDKNIFGENLCYFSSYDQDSIVDDYVYYYLKQLKSCNYKIVFISTSNNIHEKDIAKLRNICSIIIKRFNIGHDFFSWKIGIKVCPPDKNVNNIILANDSVFGPIYNLKEYIQKCYNLNYDVVGMTDSWEFQYHIQSYFLLFKKKIIDSEFIQKYFRKVQVEYQKMEIVKKYEIGLSKEIIKNGYSLYALSEYIKFNHNFEKYNKLFNQYKLNQSIFYWKLLIESKKVPFIKKNIFHLYGIENISFNEIEFILNEKNSNYPIEIIINNLKRNYSN